MNLNIKQINKDNYEEIVSLKVAKEQVSFIEPIEECLQEAKEYQIWRTVGIYDEDRAVGFAMYGLFIYEGKRGRVWLDRFLISAENQGKGYGKASVRLLIDILYKEYGYNKLYLSVDDNNQGAIALFEKIGFWFNGEKIMVIDLLVV